MIRFDTWKQALSIANINSNADANEYVYVLYAMLSYYTQTVQGRAFYRVKYNSDYTMLYKTHKQKDCLLP